MCVYIYSCVYILVYVCGSRGGCGQRRVAPALSSGGPAKGRSNSIWSRRGEGMCWWCCERGSPEREREMVVVEWFSGGSIKRKGILSSEVNYLISILD